MSSLEKNINSKDKFFCIEIHKYKSIAEKTIEHKKNNKFQYVSPLDSKLKKIIEDIIKVFVAAMLTVGLFAVIYYSSIEFINMKYGSNYEEMYDKPQSGADKIRAIPNIGEQVKIKAEREMIFNRICEEINRME